MMLLKLVLKDNKRQCHDYQCLLTLFLCDFSEANIRETIVSIFLGGADTSRAALSWNFLFAALHQDMQKRVQIEIDDVIG